MIFCLLLITSIGTCFHTNIYLLFFFVSFARCMRYISFHLQLESKKLELTLYPVNDKTSFNTFSLYWIITLNYFWGKNDVCLTIRIRYLNVINKSEFESCIILTCFEQKHCKTSPENHTFVFDGLAFSLHLKYYHLLLFFYII